MKLWHKFPNKYNLFYRKSMCFIPLKLFAYHFKLIRKNFQSFTLKIKWKKTWNNRRYLVSRKKTES